MIVLFDQVPPSGLPSDIQKSLDEAPGYWVWPHRRAAIASMSVSEIVDVIYSYTRHWDVPQDHPKLVEIGRELGRKFVRINESYVDDPPSAEIAGILNETHARVCAHDVTYCQAQCGVVRHYYGVVPQWSPIAKLERQAWLARIQQYAVL